ncbi:pyruvate formate-lyase activating enzyme [Thermoanaerobacterium xylanolyticum LX-11]|uniref:Pyruvate formate-lyase-activating enzyme n=1 Tax=Thermoanaerobacterium xylanolyticum (strain ATCC 49914 / DSM 7097 / LX-11) TaxID=858215 RepID=F6BLF0_THEXL|nr:pyruvate formate-lyase-activating protein [Thermoanaerobacterium xylanolyticum]AEF16126.1 pyruvate formate-lyase activating enzyme [Thermoanaerobacterium xylanolyticum LX-11]
MVMGKIHSIETCGTVDGPGIRYVVFMQGCPLRCAYCHNPDTWDYSCGKEVSTDEIFNDVKRYIPYMKASGGGVTLTGGEPTLQPEFCEDLFKKLKASFIHTALDTSGYVDIDKVKELVKYTDLFLLDIKHIDDEGHKKLTGVSNRKTLEFAKYISDEGKKMWIRHVIVPGITDDMEEIKKLADFVSSLKNVDRVEILPYHKMGVYKYDVLGIPYRLKGINPPDTSKIEEIKEEFKKRGMKAV